MPLAVEGGAAVSNSQAVRGRYQRGFELKHPFQMQKTKALIWLFPENIRRVEKQADSYFGGVDAQEIPGVKPEV